MIHLTFKMRIWKPKLKTSKHAKINIRKLKEGSFELQMTRDQIHSGDSRRRIIDARLQNNAQKCNEILK